MPKKILTLLKFPQYLKRSATCSWVSLCSYKHNFGLSPLNFLVIKNRFEHLRDKP